MKINNLHSWDLSPKKAIELQKQLRKEIIPKSPKEIDFSNLKIAAIDVSYARNSQYGYACAVVWDVHQKQVVEEKFADGITEFPYIPGLLSFREGKLALEVIKKIESDVDVFIFDGQGIAHPRGIGLASHIGLFLNKPCIGCAKSRLFGSFSELGFKQFSKTFLYNNDEIIGVVMRTKRRCKPIFISAGHLIDLKTSVEIIKSLVSKYRIPDPQRIADIKTKQLRKQLTK